MKVTKNDVKDITSGLSIFLVAAGAVILIGGPYLIGASLHILYGFGVGCCLVGAGCRIASAWIEHAEQVENQQKAKKIINQLLATHELDEITDKRVDLSKDYELKHAGISSYLKTINAGINPGATLAQVINIILVASLVEAIQNSSQADMKSKLNDARVGVAGVLQGLVPLLMIINLILANRTKAYQSRLDKLKDHLSFFKGLNENVRQRLRPEEKRFLLDHAQMNLVEALNQGVIPTQHQPDPADNLPTSIITRLKDYHFEALDKEKSLHYLLQEKKLTPARFLEYTDKQIKRINNIPRASMRAIVSLIHQEPAEYVLNANTHLYRVLQDKIFRLAAENDQIWPNDITNPTRIQTRQAARELLHTLQTRLPSPPQSSCRLM